MVRYRQTEPKYDRADGTKLALVVMAVMLIAFSIYWAFQERPAKRAKHWLQKEDELVYWTVHSQFENGSGRGALVLRDTLLIWTASNLSAGSMPVAEQHEEDWSWGHANRLSLGMLQPPFVLTKEAGTDTLVAIREGRTYLFHLEQPSTY